MCRLDLSYRWFFYFFFLFFLFSFFFLRIASPILSLYVFLHFYVHSSFLGLASHLVFLIPRNPHYTVIHYNLRVLSVFIVC